MACSPQKTECHICHREFATPRGLSIHKTKAGHWHLPEPPKPKPQPEKKRVDYVAIARNGNWGQEMTDQERKHPTDQVLTFAYLARIVELLESIDDSLRRFK